MIKLKRNSDATFTACPVLNDAEAQAYLLQGTVPPGVSYNPVPASKIVRNRGVWLVPNYRAHAVASMYLVSTDSAAMNVDEFRASRDQIYCYYSETSDQMYLGKIDEVDEVSMLVPVLSDQFPAVALSQLRYVGMVIATQ